MLARVCTALLVALLVMGQSKPDPQALYKAGYNARVAGDYQAAVRLLTEAIDSGKLNNDDLATSYNNRGMALAATGHPNEAIADYSMAIKIAPAYGPAYLNRGNVYSDQGKLDEAIAEFDLLIRVFPDYVLPYNSRGAAYYRKGELDKAIADYTAAIRLKPDYGNAFWNRARAYGSKGNLKQSLADFDAAIRFKPDVAEIYADRAKVRSTLNDKRGAIADFTVAIKLAPKVPLGYNNRGDTYFFAGDIDKAVADYDAASRLAPDYPDPVTSRGRIELFHKNKPAAAAADLATGVRLDPKDIYAAIWLHIARSRSGTQDREELAANAKRLGAGEWPWPVVQLFLGEATPDTVRNAASEAENDGKRNEQLCEVNFYLGIYSLERKAPDDARKLMAAAADKCPDDVLEKLAAKAELARLTH